MLQNFNSSFSDFSPNSKVWLYLSDRKFDETESDYVQFTIREFTQKNWKTHGKNLRAGGELLFNQLIVLIVDEDVNNASGCSIDSSVHMIKKLGSELKVDFFNRLFVLVINSNIVERVHVNDLTNFRKWKIINPLINNLGELKNQFIINIEDSPLFRG